MVEEQEKNSIRDTIEGLRNVKITHTNSKKYTDIVRNKLEVIESQIISLTRTYVTLNDEFEAMLKEPQIKDMMQESRIVPIDLFNLQSKIWTLAEDMLSWVKLQYEMLYIIGAKLTGAIGSVKSLDIEKEVTKNMREMNKASFDFFKEYIVEKNNDMERKFVDFQNTLNDRFEMLTHKMTSILASKIVEVQSKKDVSLTVNEINTINNEGITKENRKQPPNKDIENLRGVSEENTATEEDADDKQDDYTCELCGEKQVDEKGLASHMMMCHPMGEE